MTKKNEIVTVDNVDFIKVEMDNGGQAFFRKRRIDKWCNFNNPYLMYPLVPAFPSNYFLCYSRQMSILTIILLLMIIFSITGFVALLGYYDLCVLLIVIMAPSSPFYIISRGISEERGLCVTWNRVDHR